jgi:lipoprotein-anchoring transpeptidase ErfK/SrfK
MTSWRVASRTLIVLLSTLMLALSATIAWGAVIDFQSRGLVPKGVTIVGHDLSSMTAAQARRVITDAVSAPMLRPVTVTGDNKNWTLDPKGFETIDVDAMLAEAYSPRRSATFVTRISHQLSGEPLPADIKPAYSVDRTAIGAWVAQVATKIDRPPVSATRTIVKYAFKITPAVYGAKLNRGPSIGAIVRTLAASSALATASRTVALPVSARKPKVLESSFKVAIIVSRSERRIRLYNGAKLVKTYGCAVGMPQYPTPLGDWKIENKRYLPTWINPHDQWSGTMPDSIPPGPGNPLGTRALDLSASGIRFHGTNSDWSIGQAASHGCMRMHMWDVEDFYPRVPVNTPVFIRE